MTRLYLLLKTFIFARAEIFEAVCVKIQVFWDVTLDLWTSVSQRFEGL
jgi:hypothetical protein